MKNIFTAIASLLIIPLFTFASNITVPSAPGAGYILLSTSTGAYIATTSSAIGGGGSAVGGLNAIQVDDGMGGFNGDNTKGTFDPSTGFAQFTVNTPSAANMFIIDNEDITGFSQVRVGEGASGSDGSFYFHQIGSMYNGGVPSGLVYPNGAYINSDSLSLGGMSFATETTAPIRFGTNNALAMTIDGTTQNITMAGKLAVNNPPSDTYGAILQIYDASNPLFVWSSSVGNMLASQISGDWFGIDSPFVFQADTSKAIVFTGTLNRPDLGFVVDPAGYILMGGIGDDGTGQKLQATTASFNNGAVQITSQLVFPISSGNQIIFGSFGQPFMSSSAGFSIPNHVVMAIDGSVPRIGLGGGPNHKWFDGNAPMATVEINPDFTDYGVPAESIGGIGLISGANVWQITDGSYTPYVYVDTSGNLTAPAFITSGGTSAKFVKGDGSLDSTVYGSGTVTSVSGSGGSTGLTLTGGPITTSGTLTLGGTLAIANGGTGQTSLSSVISGVATSTNFIGLTAAKTVINTFTAGNATSSIDVIGYVKIRAIATDVAQFQISYTDENGTAQTYTGASLSTTGSNPFSVGQLRLAPNSVATTSVVLTTSIGSITYDTGATIRLISNN